MDFRTTYAHWMTVITDSGSAVFVPATPWMSALGVVDVRASVEMRNEIGLMSITPACQVADTPDAPGTTTAVGSAVTNAGFTWPTGWTAVSTETDGAQLIRFGWNILRVSGADPVSAAVAGTFEVRLG